MLVSNTVIVIGMEALVNPCKCLLPSWPAPIIAIDQFFMRVIVCKELPNQISGYIPSEPYKHIAAARLELYGIPAP